MGGSWLDVVAWIFFKSNFSTKTWASWNCLELLWRFQFWCFYVSPPQKKSGGDANLLWEIIFDFSTGWQNKVPPHDASGKGGKWDILQRCGHQKLILNHEFVFNYWSFASTKHGSFLGAFDPFPFEGAFGSELFHWVVATQIFLEFFTPSYLGKMNPFFLSIFFKGVGNNHQLE